MPDPTMTVIVIAFLLLAITIAVSVIRSSREEEEVNLGPEFYAPKGTIAWISSDASRRIIVVNGGDELWKTEQMFSPDHGWVPGAQLMSEEDVLRYIKHHEDTS